MRGETPRGVLPYGAPPFIYVFPPSQAGPPPSVGGGGGQGGAENRPNGKDLNRYRIWNHGHNGAWGWVVLWAITCALAVTAC